MSSGPDGRNTGGWKTCRILPTTPDANNTWLTEGLQNDYASHIVLGSGAKDDSTVFQTFSNGLKTNRDAWMYNFDRNRLADSVKLTIETYKDDLARWRRHKNDGKDIERFLTSDPKKISWSETLKKKVEREVELDDLDPTKFRLALYRPFTLMQTYFDPDLNERRYVLPSILPDATTELENRLIVLSNVAFRSPFSVLATNRIPEMHLCASTDGFQCFPFYTYAEDGTNRRENITEGRWNSFALATGTAPSASGTSFITSTPSCTIPTIASATRRTYAASCPAFRSSALPQGLKPRWKGRPTRR